MALADFSNLKKNLKKDFSKCKKIKLAVLGDSATQLLTQAIRAYGWEKKLDIKIYESDYDQIERNILDRNSDLYLFNPQIILVFHSYQKIQESFYGSKGFGKKSFAKNHQKKVVSYCKVLGANLVRTKIIYFNFPQINDQIFGNYSSKVETSFPFQIRKLNYLLDKLSQNTKNLFILDLDSTIKRVGTRVALDQKFWINSTLVLSLEILPVVAKNIIDIICAQEGLVKKCVILDLDNTLWGGVIGDDGIEGIQIGDLGIGKAFSQIQRYLKELSSRGIILAVNSKNNERIAKEAFNTHPEMILGLPDFAVFVANWNSKIDNILYIQKFLNIAFDSMIFLDDNPHEREMIKKTFPEITVPDLPTDPALWLEFLQEENLFETASYSDEDRKRTKYIRQDVKRIGVLGNSTDENTFLKNLNMCAQVTSFSSFDIPRVAQLTQRSNQFNLRTIRYSEEEIKYIAKSKDYLTLSVNLKDKFGELGLISVVILNKQVDGLFIDTWIMSCRVLKRGVEDLVLDTIVMVARKNKAKFIIGEYLKTPKNVLVKDHFKKLGFVKNKNHWRLRVSKYNKRNKFIENNQWTP